MTRNKRYTLSMITIAACALLLAGACATFQARSTQTTGFLGDYSQLQAGGDGKALLVYVNPDANFKSYSRVMIDPVKLYASPQHSMDDVSIPDRQKLLNYADAAFREQLAKDYTIVQQPGPGVMRLRLAITEAEDADRVLDTVSTVLPIGLAVAGLQTLATGSCSFVGSAGAEAEMIDSQTGKRLFAAVDRRIAGKITGKGDKFDEWHAVKDAVDYWAQKLQTRLAEERAR